MRFIRTIVLLPGRGEYREIVEFLTQLAAVVKPWGLHCEKMLTRADNAQLLSMDGQSGYSQVLLTPEQQTKLFEALPDVEIKVEFVSVPRYPSSVI